MQNENKKIFGYEDGALPFRYIGVPTQYKRVLNKERNQC
jgi:hypothetical protein